MPDEIKETGERKGLTGGSPVPPVVLVGAILIMAAFICLQALLRLHGESWFVRTFLAHGRVWVVSGLLLWGLAKGMDALERRMKRAGGKES